MNGRICLVACADEPLGAEVCVQLAQHGATVIMACRTKEAGAALTERVKQETGNNNVVAEILDLSVRSSIRSFVLNFKQTYQSLHVLVNQGQHVSATLEKTTDDIETMWATNVLGVHQLTARLMPMLRYCRPARIVNIVSRHAGGLDLTDCQFNRRTWSSPKAFYANAQAQQMLTWAWAAGLDGSTVTVNAVDPGPYKSDRFNELGGIQGTYLRAQDRWLGVDVAEAASSVTWLATNPDLQRVTDKLWVKQTSVRSGFRERESLLALVSLCEGTSRVQVQYDSNALFQEEYDSMVMNRTFTGF